MKNSIQTNMKFRLAIVMYAGALLLSACGGKLDGTYSIKTVTGTSVSYALKSNGTVIIDSGFAGKTETKYEMDGKTIKIIAQNCQKALLALVDDNTIEGAMGMRFLKEK